MRFIRSFFYNTSSGSFLIFLCAACIVTIIFIIIKSIEDKKLRELKELEEKEYRELKEEVLNGLGGNNWYLIKFHDEFIRVKSRQALQNYDKIKFFKENKDTFNNIEKILNSKNKVCVIISNFLANNDFTTHAQYSRLQYELKDILNKADAYRICVKYITSAGNCLSKKTLTITLSDIHKIKNDPTLLMTKGEYTKYVKEKQQEALNNKHHEYYNRVNKIIDLANNSQNKLVIKGSLQQIENLAISLYDRTVNSIKKIKNIESEEWQIIGDFINHIETEIGNVINKNQMILDYYDSPEFFKIRETCNSLMNSQKEFNEYITEKVESISKLLGTNVIRNETINEDEYEYIRPYKKTISPFTAEVSAAVFASAENSPIEYIIKKFYPNKSIYPEQINKLHLLIEELETLKEAKQIIENYKSEYQQYLCDVPDYIMENDENGFYSRLGFANIDENSLTIEYVFSYTSGGGKAKRTFPVPMTIDTIVTLIETLENKLSLTAFTKEQRSLMTNKLREFIKKRDNFTCCQCGNSSLKEPNLLLEIDHIVPVSKGGLTVENNLQTLCWKCNRAKSSKLHI